MTPQANRGPGSATRKGRSAEGRARTKGSKVENKEERRHSFEERRHSSEEWPTGRYTPPIPRSKRKSPPWFPFLIVGLLVIGMLMILLNYLGLLPASPTNWYLLGGLALFALGFFAATRYR
ncbi:MAG: cell division protein CrgA [Actinobacteria bacterium]|nr:cell division protein CrgA [Actinomycetota bacterium]MCL6095697.1 cell division protein CrgA [Actinomycetota bacterium]